MISFTSQTIYRIRHTIQASTGTSGIRAGGGAIHNAGTLKGEDLVFLQNSADCSGGAILQRNGSLVLTGVRFEGNYATVRVQFALFIDLLRTPESDLQPRFHTHAHHQEGGALCVDGPATPSIEAPATASAFIKHSVFKGHSVEPSTDAAAIHQRGALVLFNCSFWGQAAGGGASLWVGSGAISTTVAYCTFARGDGVQVEAAAPLLFSPFRCLGTPASVLAGPERAPVQGVCLGVGDAQKPHPHSHLHGISRSAAISLLIAGLLLALAAVVRHDATRSGRRRRRRRRRRSGGWVGRG